jgi:hypothetical protein
VVQLAAQRLNALEKPLLGGVVQHRQTRSCGHRVSIVREAVEKCSGSLGDGESGASTISLLLTTSFQLFECFPS